MMKTCNFPIGLEQPPQSARFSLDTLLLASFAARMTPADVDDLALELGSGCGAALLGLALQRPFSRLIGIEREGCLVKAARKNTRLLGLEKNTAFHEGDLACLPSPLLQFREKCALVLANPPWRVPGNGRISQNEVRKRAYWETENTLAHFLEKAAFFLRHHGFLCLALPIWQLVPMFQILNGLPLGVRLLLPVSSFADKDARRLLVMCRKNSATDFKLLPALTVWEKAGQTPVYTRAAREFCPWL